MAVALALTAVQSTAEAQSQAKPKQDRNRIDSLEYFNSQAATQRFGTGHPHGAIVVHQRVR